MKNHRHISLSRRRKGGFATMEFIALLAILVMLAAANTAALIHLHREVKLLEQNQIRRLNATQTHYAPASDLTVTNSISQ